MNNFKDPWDLRHLGGGYFKNIAHKSAGIYSFDVPVKLVYIGKTGESYDTPNVNPNWSAELMDGSIFRFSSTKNKIIGNEHWTANNCFVYKWEDIKDLFMKNI